MEALYKKHQKQLYKLAYSHQSRYGGDIKYLIAEANWIFLNAVKKWSPQKSKFSTFLQLCVRGGLRNYSRAYVRSKERERLYGERRGRTFRMDKNQFLENIGFDSFSTEAKEMIQLVLTAPGELGEALEKPGKKTKLKNHLWSAGWSYTQIKKTFQEIQEALS